uniref:Uncharacterized protein n=1 Tax=Oryza meridionalis TaxID=40149 RepID=A0A0E0DHK0_9ORYZ
MVIKTFKWAVKKKKPESLNNVFKFSRRLPVAAIVEETFSKSVEWFVERRKCALKLIDTGKVWSQRVENLLVKRGNKAGHMHRGNKAGHMHVTSYGDEVGIYEVKVENELVPIQQGNHIVHTRREFKYK